MRLAALRFYFPLSLVSAFAFCFIVFFHAGLVGVAAPEAAAAASSSSSSLLLLLLVVPIGCWLVAAPTTWFTISSTCSQQKRKVNGRAKNYFNIEGNQCCRHLHELVVLNGRGGEGVVGAGVDVGVGRRQVRRRLLELLPQV